MPELPEVETVRRMLENEVLGKRIEHVDVFRDKNVVTGAEEFKEAVKGKRIEKMGRVGKFLIFHLSGGLALVSHLRMEGKYYDGSYEDPVSKHEILRFRFEDGSRLSYLDTRKFGVIYLKKEDELMSTPPLTEVGTEPWATDPEGLLKAYRRKKGPLKEALLDQGIMCGLGNIYADEVLYATGLHPLKTCPTLTLDDAKRIVEESSQILKMAIENGGSTIRSYHPKEGMDGRMQNALKAYGMVGHPCERCSFPLAKIRVGGRGTTYCPHCQRDEEHPFVVSVTGPIASGKSSVGRYLEAKGFRRIDLDEVVRELYQDPAILEEVDRILGLSPKENGLDRKAALEILAKDQEKKKELEAYVHPLAYKRAVEEAANSHADKVVYEVPFYLGSPIEEITNCLIYVEASQESKKKRILDRGKNPEEALALNGSYSWLEAKKKANVVLSTDGSVDELIAKLQSYQYLG